MMIGKLFVISACSGAGKTTLIRAVVQRLASDTMISRIITYTTKAPRSCEVNGVDYHFISENEFERKINEAFFLEWSRAYGAYYGSPRTLIPYLKGGGHAIIVTDVQGAHALKGQIEDAVLIWIDVSSNNVIKQRLEQRNSENNEQIQERFLISLDEKEKYLNERKFHYSILNDKFEIALSELESIIRVEIKK